MGPPRIQAREPGHHLLKGPPTRCGPSARPSPYIYARHHLQHRDRMTHVDVPLSHHYSSERHPWVRQLRPICDTGELGLYRGTTSHALDDQMRVFPSCKEQLCHERRFTLHIQVSTLALAPSAELVSRTPPSRMSPARVNICSITRASELLHEVRLVVW